MRKVAGAGEPRPIRILNPNRLTFLWDAAQDCPVATRWPTSSIEDRRWKIEDARTSEVTDAPASAYVPPDQDEWRDLGVGSDDQESTQIEEYDLSSVPNDFNVITICNFIESGAVKIPGFQRNYVWDLPRASKLVESLILGLPVPQVFLYEAGRNDFLVIDGQQRLLTIYFFVKQRFPKRTMRGELRKRLAGQVTIPDDVLHEDKYFDNFNLRLPRISEDTKNKFASLKYSTLGDYKAQFELRTIRNIIVKQVRPSDDDSSIYEMFHRLNSGGVNLSPQEIRSSLYYSPFIEMLADVNLDPRWRTLIGQPSPDLHLRDVEVLLRAIAMSTDAKNYKSSMAGFLNQFSKLAKGFDQLRLDELQARLLWFIGVFGDSPNSKDYFMAKNGRFTVTLFESVFSAACLQESKPGKFTLDPAKIRRLRDDEKFLSFSQAGSSHRSNVEGRLRRAEELLV